jgi:hypothetical protein
VFCAAASFFFALSRLCCCFIWPIRWVNYGARREPNSVHLFECDAAQNSTSLAGWCTRAERYKQIWCANTQAESAILSQHFICFVFVLAISFGAGVCMQRQLILYGNTNT